MMSRRRSAGFHPEGERKRREEKRERERERHTYNAKLAIFSYDREICTHT